jgi:hypothetical protein
MPKSPHSWVRSQHPPQCWIQYILKKSKKIHLSLNVVFFLPVGFQSGKDYCYTYFPTKVCVKGLRSEMDFLVFFYMNQRYWFISHNSYNDPGGRRGVVCCTWFLKQCVLCEQIYYWDTIGTRSYCTSTRMSFYSTALRTGLAHVPYIVQFKYFLLKHI